MKKLLSVILAAVILTSAAAMADEYDPLLYCGTPHFHAYAPAQYERYVGDEFVGVNIGTYGFTFQEVELFMDFYKIADNYDAMFDAFRAELPISGELCASGTVNMGIKAKYEIYNTGDGLYGFSLFPGEGYMLAIGIYSTDADSQALEQNAVTLLKYVWPIYN